MLISDQAKDDRRRLDLRRRLLKLLKRRGYEPGRLERGKARPDDSARVTLTYEEIAEIAGALSDATQTASLERKGREAEQWLRELRARLTGRNPRPVLRAFRLTSSKRDRAFWKDLETASYYARLIRTAPFVESPERTQWERSLTLTRRFGEAAPVLRGRPPGEVIRSPIEPVQALVIIERWFGFRDVYQARYHVLAGRKAIREALRRKLWFPDYPPPYETFPVPDKSTLDRATRIK